MLFFFFFCMSSSSLSNIVFDFVIFLLNTLTNLLFAYHRHYSANSLPNDTVTQHHCHLQAARVTLLCHKDEISHRIEEIDIAIQHIQASHTTSVSSTIPDSSPVVSFPNIIPSPNLQRKPIRRRLSTNNRQIRADEPYPLPYRPPRTPDEERKNRIVTWVNELRSRNNSTS
jgi:hypothetical protein